MFSIDWEDYTTSEFLTLNAELNEYYLATFGDLALCYRAQTGVEDVNDFFIAFEDKTPVGIVCFKPFPAPRTAEIKRLFVREDYRGKGYGAALLSKVEAAVKLKGYKSAVLVTGAQENNRKTVDFYLKNGYNIVERFAPFVGDENVLCLKKEL